MPGWYVRAAFCVGAAALVATTPVHAAVPHDPRWELTLATGGEHSAEGWDSGMPEAEIKYQWSDRVELEAKLGWKVLDPPGGTRQSGIGNGEFALKYRFVDKDRAGFAMSVFPQISRSLSGASVRRGVASGNAQYGLGVETKVAAGATELELKLLRNFIEREPNAWAMELKAATPCGAPLACELEVERDFQPGSIGQTFVRMGLILALAPGYELKAALGRDFGPYESGQTDRALAVELKMRF
jgi:hypothetical protein